ncbi:BlaI/MecI/CopY family transcriptional regulator [Falsarthrobacter nasiphocae]|uniref:Transcriptional regulator n=1 Tax=Falsarthrobacter nasiphocae TaxID=189863 RepID=A0AAE4C5A0_9MICC|nr:BlaI/MecI/CopY family transcriptional regulator [Falsarthrobacter nasiphocae]MDR6891278.1 putative transcriptional regulator [Falsarthrobacter nasiphocae]
MGHLGDLERDIMNRLWSEPDHPLSATEIRDALANGGVRDVAVTTVLTVLSRLEKKNLVRRERSARPHRYSAVQDRAAHTADLMSEVLEASDDREAALARFVGHVSAEEAELLRRLLHQP